MPSLHQITAAWFIGLLFVHGLFAQDADTTRSDTLRIPPAVSDSLDLAAADSSAAPIVQRDLIPFMDAVTGLAIGDTLPARHPALDAVGVLSDVAGSFVYDFGAAGWPDGWSPFALNPNSIALSFNGIPFNDAVTGRPAFELLPLSTLQPLHIQADRYGAPVGVNTRLLALDVSRPLTQIRYGTSSNGLQSVLVIHNQLRRIPLGRQMGVFGFTLGYGGHGANGEYPGSRLAGARQFLVRLRYGHPRASIELINFSNRRRLGAHAGVEPIGADFNTIYNRFSARVTNPNATRQELRNDLGLTVQSRLIPGLDDAFTASGYWTASTFRYVNGDTLQARTHRFGYTLEQAFSLASQRLTLILEGWNEQLRRGSPALPDSLDISRRALHASALAQVRLAGFSLDLQPGLHRNEHETFAGGRIRLAQAIGGLSLFAEVSHSGTNRSWVEEYGWGNTVEIPTAIPSTRITLAHAGLRLEAGPFDAGLSAFRQHGEDLVDFFSDNDSDTIRAAVFPSTVQWNGATVDIGFRRRARRGFYLTAAPSVYMMTDPEISAAHRALNESMPELFARGRVGLRYRLFRGDLDMDLYGQGRLWSPFRSRTLHPQTGLLVLRDDGARNVEGSAAVDVVLEAGVRSAKIFVAFENLLSGTSFIPGNMLVPTYPLPERRFRFGVYWPIQD